MSRVFPRCRTLFCPPAGYLSGLTIHKNRSRGGCVVFPSLLVRIHRTHQTERGSASSPDAGAHAVPGLQSRGESHGSEVIVVVGSLLCVPYRAGNHARDAISLSAAPSKPFRAQRVPPFNVRGPDQGRYDFSSHPPPSPATTQGKSIQTLLYPTCQEEQIPLTQSREGG